MSPIGLCVFTFGLQLAALFGGDLEALEHIAQLSDIGLRSPEQGFQLSPASAHAM